HRPLSERIPPRWDGLLRARRHTDRGGGNQCVAKSARQSRRKMEDFGPAAFDQNSRTAGRIRVARSRSESRSRFSKRLGADDMAFRSKGLLVSLIGQDTSPAIRKNTRINNGCCAKPRSQS